MAHLIQELLWDWLLTGVLIILKLYRLEIKDSGSGNQVNFLSGFTYTIGDFKSLLIYIKTYCSSLMPNDVQAPGRLRNIQDHLQCV
jgi:hypothetical protein